MICIKAYIRNNYFWLATFIYVQIFFISAFSFYYANTNYCCEIEMFSEKPSQVEFVTPIGNKYTEHIEANCKTIIPKRPLKQIKVDSNISLSCSTNKVSAIDVFVFLRGRGFLLTWIFVSILCITAILINKKEIIVTKVVKPLKQKWHITKRKFYKYLLRGKTNNAKTLKIDKKSYITLIVLAVLWITIAFVPYKHKQIGQHESGKWRALVALEMKISDNYIVPTRNGEPYCKKPPLFNYMLLPALESKQNAINWMQFISTFTVFIFIVCVFLVSRKLLDNRKSLLATIIFAYSICVINNSSIIGLDSLFSTLCLLIIISNLYFAKRNKYLTMFLVGYLLTALAFMTKGTPAIYFQAISLFSIMVCTKSYKHIFSWKHIVGISPFIVIVGTYCLLYSQYNNPLSWFLDMFNDVPTKLETGTTRRITNILSFYGKSILAYPILALLPILFRRNTLIKIIKNESDSYLMLVSLLGMLPFFIGDYYPKYILMLTPILTILIVKHLKTEYSIKSKILLWAIPLIFVLIAVLLGFGEIYLTIAIIPFVLLLHNCKWLQITTFCLYAFALCAFMLHIKYAPAKESPYTNLENKAWQIAKETGNAPLYVLPNSKLNHATIFYLTFYKEEIIRFANENLQEGDYYLTNQKLEAPIDSIPESIHAKTPDPYCKTRYDAQLYLYKK